MQKSRIIKSLILGFIIIQSCNLHNENNGNIRNGKIINDTKIVNRVFNFIDYDSVILALKYKVYKGINNNYNLEFILLLDSTEKELINKEDPDIIKEVRSYYSSDQENDYKVGFYTEKEDIKEVFRDNYDQTRIIECLFTENKKDTKASIEKNIHIKGNKAIFEISGSKWSDTYLAKLDNSIFQIYLLGGYLED